MDDRKLQTTEMGRLPRQPSGTRWTGRIATVQRSSARRGAASINVGGWFCRRHPDKVGGWFLVLCFQKSGVQVQNIGYRIGSEHRLHFGMVNRPLN